MAIYRPTITADPLTGPLGGLTCTHHRRTAVLRYDRRRSGPSTPAQYTYRAASAEAVRLWDSMPDADRAAWREWADLYGSAVEAPELAYVSGPGRFRGQAVVRLLAGLPPVGVPSWPGLGPAPAPRIRFLANEGAGVAEITMLEPYPTPPTGSAVALVFASPPQPLSVQADRKRSVVIGPVDLAGGGPGVGGPPAVLPLRHPLGYGRLAWVGARAADDAGYTSRLRKFRYEQPPVGQLRVARVGPLLDFLGKQAVEVTPSALRLHFFMGTGDAFTIDYSLTTGTTATIGGLLATVEADAIWGVWQANSEVASRPSTDLVLSPPVVVGLSDQPQLLTLHGE